MNGTGGGSADARSQRRVAVFQQARERGERCVARASEADDQYGVGKGWEQMKGKEGRTGGRVKRS